MQRKYELLDSDTVEKYGFTLKRIRYLIDIPQHGIKVGDLGGYIDKDDVLSHEGDIAIIETAKVIGWVTIKGDGIIKGTDTLYRKAN